jgi:hypothetical protein
MPWSEETWVTRRQAGPSSSVAPDGQSDCWSLILKLNSKDQYSSQRTRRSPRWGVAPKKDQDRGVARVWI